jgi:hypothetical protein
MPYFALHNVTLAASGYGCRFDVRPTDFVLLNQGTREMVSEMMGTIGVKAAPETWQIESFCSPYFADSETAGDPHDKYKQVFGVNVTFTEPAALPAISPFKPFLSDARDPSFQPKEDDPDPMIWSVLPCTVIADFIDRPAGALLAEPLVAGRATTVDVAPGIVQVRVAVGAVDAKGAFDGVEGVLAACRSHGASTSWRSSLAAFLQRR